MAEYYQVPKKLAGQHYVPALKTHITFVENELLTQKECERMNINRSVLRGIKVSRKKTYILFGARFHTEDAKVTILTEAGI